MQWSVILVLSGAAWILGGSRVAQSLLCGGAAVALPNALFALWLTLRVLRAGSAGVVAMFAGEMAKLCMTLALLVLAAAKLKAGLSWLALIGGVIAALKAQWLAVWVTRDR